MKLSFVGSFKYLTNSAFLKMNRRPLSLLILMIAAAALLAACNRAAEREVIEVPTAVAGLEAIPTVTPKPTNTSAPTSEPTSEPTEIPEPTATTAPPEESADADSAPEADNESDNESDASDVEEVADDDSESEAAEPESDAAEDTDSAEAEDSDTDATADTDAADTDDTDTDDTATGEIAEIKVEFLEPQDGAVVTTTVGVQMGAIGVAVEPAGDVKEGSGHMHILVNTEFVPAGEVIVNDETHLHFGKAQLEAALELPPGEHVLRLQLADGAHVALEGDQYRDEITVTVSDSEGGDTEEETADDGSDADDETADDGSDTEEETADDGSDADDEAADSDEDSDADAPADGDEVAVRPAAELWTTMACSACHNINEDQTEDNVGQPGPYQNNIDERAGERVEGQSAEEYVYQSIVNPNDYVVEPYVANVMPQNFGEQMSEAEIRGLVDWMLDRNREGAP